MPSLVQTKLFRHHFSSKIARPTQKNWTKRSGKSLKKKVSLLKSQSFKNGKNVKNLRKEFPSAKGTSTQMLRFTASSLHIKKNLKNPVLKPSWWTSATLGKQGKKQGVLRESML